MKKRIAMALGMLFVVLLLGACGTDPADADYNGYSYSDLRTQSKNSYAIAESLANFFGQYGFTAADITEDDRDAFTAQNGISAAQFDSGFRWLELTEELGVFRGADEDSFSVEKAGNTLTTNVRLRFEKRDVDFQVVYTYYNMKVSGITMEPVYSLSEKMGKAGINTVISVLIVFCVLVLISLLIACFKIFPYLEKKGSEKKAAVQAGEQPGQPVMNRVEVREEPQSTDDTELVAVIAAAIAAATGSSASDFVVRSINRRK